ncbi:cell division protein FtsX [Psychroflexus salis]|uniref:Cell division protein FtsX n=1 Tax=Psychroflexus salis TaxID=1526574 RepID=A0A916ZSL8_9FLAO|nr:permease-like cell division protein FtsX [Psychroflexus salis]GGE09403.1 cell division protein FtsX [Psychroflexus salis]
MASSFERYQRRRLISSYFSVVISIALVLFILGSLGLIVLNTKKVADYFKEQVALSVFFDETAKEIDIEELQKSLSLSEFTKSANFVSKEEAAEMTKKDLGEDFMDFLGYNPLKNSIDVYFNADYVTEVQLAEIKRDLMEYDYVDKVVYDKPLIALLNDNIKKLSFWILVICGVFTFIAVLLINSSIRLSVYSKRFIIKTMQMVGATKGFIRRPFIWKSIKLGIVGSILSLAGMAVLMYYLNEAFPNLNLLKDPIIVGSVFAGIFILGIIITWISTFFATQRFLNLKTDELYY